VDVDATVPGIYVRAVPKLTWHGLATSQLQIVSLTVVQKCQLGADVKVWDMDMRWLSASDRLILLDLRAYYPIKAMAFCYSWSDSKPLKSFTDSPQFTKGCGVHNMQPHSFLLRGLSVAETLAEGNEGALHLGPERAQVYSDLSPEDKDRYNADIRATNILLQGLPKDIYALINHYTDAKDIWDNVKMLLEELHQIQGTKPQFKTAVVVQNVQGRHNRGQGNNARGAGATGYGGAQNRVGNGIPGQARQTKCYNYNAQENRVALDEEQLLFIVGGQDNVVDEDMDEQPFQDLALNTMFMANLSSADPVYDEASPSYDSDILSEVPNHDNYQDAICEHHEVHEMHDDYVKDNSVPVVQSNVSFVPNDAYMMILNDMHEQPAQCASVTTQNNVVDNH
ncbi:hypothetical protein Tco_1324931, partial [Tanacetum coccineum]